MLVLMLPPSLGRVAASARGRLLADWFLHGVGCQVQITVAKDYDELRCAILEREVDIAWAPPVLCAQIDQQAIAILKAIRGGRSTYRAALVVRRGEVSGLDELHGTRAAWVDRLSTAGHLLPIAHLRARGLDPESVFEAQTFAGSYGRALRAVHEREADVTAIYVHETSVDGAHRNVVELMGQSVPLQVLEITSASPSDGLVVLDRPGVRDRPELLSRLRDATDRSTHSLLLNMLDADGLEPAAAADYQILRELVS